VVKVGGSLLQFDCLAKALGQWLQRHADCRNVLLVGGGALADWVRETDRRFALGDEAAHWLAVGTMSVTAQVVSHLLSHVPSVRLTWDWDEPLRADDDGDGPNDWILDPRDFLRRCEPDLPGRVLSRSWRTTSDSIAARLATLYRADELVMLKSCSAPTQPSLPAQPAPQASGWLEQLAAGGYVDEDFPLAAVDLPRVRFVDLRATALSPMQYR
jgi:aspartokinase-like uncharacterized kinase